MNQNPKSSNEGSHYIDFGPVYINIPTELIHDSDIRPSGRRRSSFPFYVFCFIRSLCWKRALKDLPYHFGSQAYLADLIGVSRWAISTAETYLHKIKWIEKIRLGQGKSNIIVLLSYKGQKLSSRELQLIKDRVRLQQRKWKNDHPSSTG